MAKAVFLYVPNCLNAKAEKLGIYAVFLFAPLTILLGGLLPAHFGRKKLNNGGGVLVGLANK